MESKSCKRCCETKPVSEFYRQSKTGVYASNCKPCFTIVSKENKIKNKELYRKTQLAWIERNKEKVRQSNIKCRIKRKDKEKAWAKGYREKNHELLRAKDREYKKNNRERLIANKKEWSAKNKTKIREYVNNKKKTNPLFKISEGLRGRIRIAFTRKNWRKDGSTRTLLGAEITIVKLYIERQFKKGMSWENHGYGNGCWHIDHIIPIASAKTEEEMVGLCHYTNLQPLWANENLSKGNRILKPTQVILPI